MSLYIVLIGVQGAGKGTQAKFISENHNIPHISTGDLFRAMKTQDTPLAREVQELMRSGHLISDEVTNRMVDDRLSQPDAQNGAILDGYPRNLAQAAALSDILAKQNASVDLALLLELDREVAIKRAEGRRFSADKQRVYNVYYNPPKVEGKDDVTGEDLIQREDDHLEAVEKRVNTYFEETMPIVDYYRELGVLQTVNAEQSIAEVRANIEKVIASV